MNMDDENVLKEVENRMLANADKVIFDMINKLTEFIKKHEIGLASTTAYDIFLILFRSTLVDIPLENWQSILDSLSRGLWDSPNEIKKHIRQLPDPMRRRVTLEVSKIKESIANPYERLQTLEELIIKIKKETGIYEGEGDVS